MLEASERVAEAGSARRRAGSGSALRRGLDRVSAHVDVIVLAVATAFAFHTVLRLGAYHAIDETGDAAQFFVPASTSPLLIVAGATWMITHRRYRIARALEQPPAPLIALPLLAAGCGLLVWSHWVSAPDLAVPALAISLLGGAAAIGGVALTRLIALPAAFLLLALPLPGYWLNHILFPMQLASAGLTTGLVHLVGGNATHSLDLVFVGRRVFHVIETCAGFRMIETLFMASILYTELFPSGRLRRALVIASAPIVAFLLNAVRILSIIYFPIETSHTFQGIMVLVLGILVLARIDRSLAHIIGDVPVHPAPAAVRLPRRSTGMVSGILVTVGIVTLVAPPYVPSTAAVPELRRLPTHYGDWQGTGARLDKDFMGSVQPRRFSRYTLQRGADQMSLYVAVDDLLDRGRSIVSPKLLYMTKGAHVVEEDRETLPDGRTVWSALYRSYDDGAWWLSRLWYGGTSGGIVEATRSLLALDRSPLRREAGSYVVHLSRRIDTDVSSAEALARAESDLDEVAGQIDASMRSLRGESAATRGAPRATTSLARAGSSAPDPIW